MRSKRLHCWRLYCWIDPFEELSFLLKTSETYRMRDEISEAAKKINHTWYSLHREACPKERIADVLRIRNCLQFRIAISITLNDEGRIFSWWLLRFTLSLESCQPIWKMTSNRTIYAQEFSNSWLAGMSCIYYERSLLTQSCRRITGKEQFLDWNQNTAGDEYWTYNSALSDAQRAQLQLEYSPALFKPFKLPYTLRGALLRSFSPASISKRTNDVIGEAKIAKDLLHISSGFRTFQ